MLSWDSQSQTDWVQAQRLIDCFVFRQEIYFFFSVTTERATTPRPTNPCQPDPCGKYAQCRERGGVAACSCLPGYIGTPPNCRPECLIHSECRSNLACIDEKCRDPCPGACAANADCTVIKHNAVCQCRNGYEGDPFSGCRRVTTSEYSMPFICFIKFPYFLSVFFSMFILLKTSGNVIIGFKKICFFIQFI